MGYYISETGYKTLVNGVKKDVTDFFLHRDWFSGLRTGQLWSKGNNALGQLGIENTTNRSEASEVGNKVNWTKVSAGEYHAAAAQFYDYNETDQSVRNKVWAWGANSQGQLGVGDTLDRSSPTQVGTLRSWKTVSAGGYHTLFLKYGGALWSSGDNVNGQLGHNDTINRSSPVEVGAVNVWHSCSAGRYHSVAVRTDGTMWSWGANWSGQLGNNSTINRSSPTQVGTLNTWLSSIQCIVASRSTTHLIKKDGTMWAWGESGQGELGNNSTVNKSSPIQIGTDKDWRQMAPGGTGGHAVKTDGTLWGWGLNTSGQLGDNTTVTKSSPVQIGAMANWFKVTSSLDTTFAINQNNEIWGWGLGSSGTVGVLNTVSRSSPVLTSTLGNWYDITAGINFTIGQSL